MPYALRDWTCPDCGKGHRRRGPAGTPMRCHPCSIAYAAECSRQMAAKSGPAWDTWVFRSLAAARRMAKDDRPVRARRAA